MLVTAVAGLTVRFAPVGLPPFIVKYGGSMLWALMIYWIVSTLLPSWRLLAALLAGALATAVEFIKLIHSPLLDAFRLTFPGIVLLGRVFSGWDIVAYWLAISLGAFADRGIRSAQRQRASSR
jgi:carbon starvation protein CstA